ncbi:MAG: PqqD family protein [Planctomycetota bacterium]
MNRRDLAGLTLEDLLTAVPVRNRAVREERRGQLLRLWVKRKQFRGVDRLLRMALPLRDEKGIELDELGKRVWLDCNGSRTVERITERFAERHGLRFHEARVSVMAFLEMLLKRSLIGVAVMERGVDGQEGGAGLREDAEGFEGGVIEGLAERGER